MMMKRNCSLRVSSAVAFFPGLQLLFGVILLFPRTVGAVSWRADGEESENKRRSIYRHDREIHNRCDIYMAPSKLGGWGVFAGRDFELNEIVEVSPLFLYEKKDVYDKNVLIDYHYTFNWPQKPYEHGWGGMYLGMTMFYNHGSDDERNVRMNNFGLEPDLYHPSYSMAVGFMATKRIQRGEEILSSYGDEYWFNVRGYYYSSEPKDPYRMLPKTYLEKQEQRFCSKIYAGYGLSTWNHRILPSYGPRIFNPYVTNAKQFLPMQDHPTAVARESAIEGDVLEISPALVVPADQMANSSLAPLCIFWAALDDDNRMAIYTMRMRGLYRMKKQMPSEVAGALNMSHDELKSLDDAAVLPAGGTVGMIRKVGNGHANCRIQLSSTYIPEESEFYDSGSAGVLITVIATRDIEVGEELLLNLPDQSSWISKITLVQALALTGQPIPKHLADVYNPDPIVNATATS